MRNSETRICLRALCALSTALVLLSHPVYAQKAPTPKFTGADIVDGSLTSADIADTTITAADIAPNSLTGASINESTLDGIDADTIDGIDSSEIPRGKSSAFKRTACLEETATCPQSVQVTNSDWPFTIFVNCGFASSTTVRMSAYAGPASATSGPIADAEIDINSFGNLKVNQHAEGSPVIIDGVSTATLARIEIYGWYNSVQRNCTFTGMVQEAPYF